MSTFESKVLFDGLQRPQLYAAAILLGMLIGGMLAYVTMHAKDAEMRKALLQAVQSIEQALDWQVVEQQSFAQINAFTPEWQKFISKLDGVCDVTPDCKWIYLTYQDAQGNIREIASTLNDAGREDYTPPNTIYAEATAEYQAHFKTRQGLVEGPTQDEWGVWVTAAVIHKTPNVDGRYVSIGLDISAKNWRNKTLRSAILPIIFTLAYLALIIYLLIKNLREQHKNRQLTDKADQLYIEASRDYLTGLPNRALFEDRLKQVSHSAERALSSYAIFFMDLDGFKAVNDRHGHKIGDEVLKAFANRISGVLRVEDTLARFGGDEFVLLIPKIRYKKHLHTIAQKIIKVTQAQMEIQGTTHQLGISIGFAIAPQDTHDANQLIKMADEAMFLAKKQGKNQVKSYQELLKSQ